LQQELAQAGRRLPVVIVTGQDKPGMRARCLGAGASAYLRKPLDEQTLLAAIEAAINSARSSGLDNDQQ
jgi:FixJ family two-component response regulator